MATKRLTGLLNLTPLTGGSVQHILGLRVLFFTREGKDFARTTASRWVEKEKPEVE